MSKPKYNCSDCIHIDVCEWAVEGQDIICSDFIDRNELRPRGEWIIVKDEKWGDNVKCPFCEKELAGTDLNFCCKCGADMRGDKT